MTDDAQNTQPPSGHPAAFYLHVGEGPGYRIRWVERLDPKLWPTDKVIPAVRCGFVIEGIDTGKTSGAILHDPPRVIYRSAGLNSAVERDVESHFMSEARRYNKLRHVVITFRGVRYDVTERVNEHAGRSFVAMPDDAEVHGEVDVEARHTSIAYKPRGLFPALEYHIIARMRVYDRADARALDRLRGGGE